MGPVRLHHSLFAHPSYKIAGPLWTIDGEFQMTSEERVNIGQRARLHRAGDRGGFNRRYLAATLALLFAVHSQPAIAEAVGAGSGVFDPQDIPECRTDLAYLNQLFGWQLQWPQAWAALAKADNAKVRSALADWSGAADALATDQAALAQSLSGGSRALAPRVVVERVLSQVDSLATGLDAGPPPLAPATDPVLARQWRDLFRLRITPAVHAYQHFIRDQYLSRSGDDISLDKAGGPRCFGAFVKTFTTVDLPPAEIERIGWQYLKEAEEQLLAANHKRRSELPALLQDLRHDEDASFTRSDLIRKSKQAVQRAIAAAPAMFSRPIIVGLDVEPIAPAMEDSFPAGLYRGPAQGKPAIVLNTSRPADRKLMAEVIAFHEGLPGHHAAAALGYPAGEFNSGFLEGWAVYSEFLADEFHLFDSPQDRNGMFAKHLWAASRLVVEPGINLHHWSRKKAVDFMFEHTALPRAEIELEVDRYIATPGQSLSYMLGYDAIEKARRYAQAKLERRFDLRKFHDVVLSGGSRPLSQVTADVKKWADAR